ncbi:MAG: TIGR01212 family radical SAM protein [Bacteroidaceae bacterium]|nr:TIGR01212 family radical SAM protein [Bacteroidaceae bacterium]
MRSLSAWLQAELGCRVQKLSVDAGFTCPNRDGTLGVGGCSFCDNHAFTPSYCVSSDSVTEQLEKGKRFFARKHKRVKYVAYFQSYSSTYASLSHLQSLYEEALRVPDVVGLIVGTRPDCVSPSLLDYLQALSRRTFLLVEYGVESISDETLCRVHRGHTYAQARRAIIETAERGIHVGAHFILGFPWENYEDVMLQAREVATLPLTTLKLHQLQVLRGTPLAQAYEANPWESPSASDYARLVRDYLRHLPASLVLDRFVSQSPPHRVLAPRWGIKNTEFLELLRYDNIPPSTRTDS